MENYFLEKQRINTSKMEFGFNNRNSLKDITNL